MKESGHDRALYPEFPQQFWTACTYCLPTRLKRFKTLIDQVIVTIQPLCNNGGTILNAPEHLRRGFERPETSSASEVCRFVRDAASTDFHFTSVQLARYTAGEGKPRHRDANNHPPQPTLFGQHRGPEKQCARPVGRKTVSTTFCRSKTGVQDTFVLIFRPSMHRASGLRD